MDFRVPVISVVTPSYNQGSFLQATIDSVLAQDYANRELIIMDGASEDDSVDIIRKHAHQIAYWISEPDRGQSHAINKGFAKATGDIYCWINSDDLLAPNSLHRIADYFTDNPDAVWCTGQCQLINAEGLPRKVLQVDAGVPLSGWLTHLAHNRAAILQPSTFWRRSAWEAIGPLREDLHYAFDFEFFYRLRERFGPPGQLSAVLSQFRLHGASKTVSSRELFFLEVLGIVREKMPRLPADERAIVAPWLDFARGKECFLRQQRALAQGDALGHWRWRMLGWSHRLARALRTSGP